MMLNNWTLQCRLHVRHVLGTCMVFFILIAAGATPVRSDAVSLETARVVAQNKVLQHLDLYGTWNGSPAPWVGDGQPVVHEDLTVAYNFQVSPSGHVLVAADDAFSPVLLYSATSTFDPDRRSDPNSVESWLLPELHHNTRALADLRRAAGGSLRMLALTEVQSKINSAWEFLTGGRTAADKAASLSELQRNLVRSATVGPLLTTIWGQTDPYNLMTPAGSTCNHTLTGCVATAWAQLARYWRWPSQGLGSHSYPWNGQILSVDFSAATYDWDNMPDELTASSTQVEKDAVALLMYHMGVAADMYYGCDGSGSSAWADDRLDIFFNYKANMNWLARADYSESEWFALFQAEFDAVPPRPVILSIFETGGGGHEVVADGYQNDSTNLIHLNLGWDGYDDGFYNITSDFSAGGYTWEANGQYIVAHIAPNDDPPTVEAGSDQSVEEGTSVTLTGSVSDLNGATVSSYEWTRISGPYAVLSNSTSDVATFIAPNVATDSTIVFNFRAVLSNGAFASDVVSVSVEDTGSSSLPPPTSIRRSASGSSTGGCFVMSLF